MFYDASIRIQSFPHVQKQACRYNQLVALYILLPIRLYLLNYEFIT